MSLTFYKQYILIILIFSFTYPECKSAEIKDYRSHDSIYLQAIKEVVAPNTDLKINEVLCANTDVNTDSIGDYDDWIELYNYSDDSINLKGLCLSDSRSDLSKFQISIDTILPPKQFLLVWADGENVPRTLHTNFKLDADGESIYISTQDLQILDSVVIPKQTNNVSYGRLKNNFLTWNYFINPTPGYDNNQTGALEVLQQPSINYSSGYFNNSICVELSQSDNNAFITYTLNGDIPTINSKKYSDCISISSTTVLRCRVFKEGYIPSNISTRSYFFETSKDLDVLAISIHNEDITGNTGIFFTKNRNVEKPVHIEYFGNDSKLKFKIDGGMQLHSPKGVAQVSLRLYARSDYGYESMDYQIFKNKNINSFKRLILRNSGNDCSVLKKDALIHFRDGLHQELLAQTNNLELTSAYRPVNVYINGKYYGIYNARERIDKYFIESNFGYTGDMDLLERAFSFPGNKNAIEGSFDLYNSILTFINDHDLSIEQNYNFVAGYIDIDRYIDYWINEVYIGNFDWLVNNIKIFRPDKSEAKFKWILWDTDHGSGLPYSTYGDPEWATLSWSLSIGQSRTEGGSTTILHRGLIQNESFRIKFINRYADLLNTVYGYNNIERTIDSIAGLLKNDMVFHAERWGNDYSRWLNAVDYVKNYHKQRTMHVRSDINTYFGLSGYSEVVFKTNDQNAGTIKINSISPEFKNNEWKGTYFQNVPITLIAQPEIGYKFSGWTKPSNVNNSLYTLSVNEGDTIMAVFEKLPIDFSGLIISEIDFIGESGNNGDWIEISNKSGSKLSLSNWKLLIDNDTVQFDDLIVNMDDCFVVTNNINKTYNTTYKLISSSNFEIDKKGSCICLLNAEGTLIDSVNFKPVPPWSTLSSQFGFTMELSDLYADNALAENWRSSVFLGGSPGEENPYINYDLANIVINEIMADNYNTIRDEFNEFDDWIELYNKGNTSIRVEGLFITDDLKNPIKYQIPYNNNSISLAPGKFLLLWADNNIGQGPYHLNFKLDSDGEELGLFYNNGYELVKIDQIEFLSQYKQISFGREYDGVGSSLTDWLYLDPTPGAFNNEMANPNKINAFTYSNSTLFPNPATNELFIRLTNNQTSNFSIVIYNITGKLQNISISNFDKKLLRVDVSKLQKGVYFIKINNGINNYFIKKFIKE